MGYDAANRLSRYAAKDGDAVVLTQENQYNGNGQRIQKKETKGQKTKANNYYYQNGTLLYTTDESGKRTSLNLMGVENNVIATARDEKWYLYNKDMRGSTSSLVDGTGAVAAAYEYDDFGNTEARVGADFENEICYTGQVYDWSTGLYYYNARFYDPENGRFVSQDSYRGEVKEPDTLHLYVYCANNPINHIDTSGHSKQPIHCYDWYPYEVRGKGTMVVRFNWWKSNKLKKVESYHNPRVTKQSSFGRATRILKAQTTPKGRFVKTLNVRAAMGVWKFFFGGIVRDMRPWSVLIMDINIRANKTIKIRKKSVSYETYKRWPWGKF